MYKRSVSVDDVMRIIEVCMLRRSGPTDEMVAERGALLLENDVTVEPEAFAQLAMFLNADSPHAPQFHRYAAIRFENNPDAWHWIGELARSGSPLRQMASDTYLRSRATDARRFSNLDYFTPFFQDAELWGITLGEVRDVPAELPTSGPIHDLLTRMAARDAVIA